MNPEENISSHSLLEIPWEQNITSIEQNKEYLTTKKQKIIEPTPKEEIVESILYPYEFDIPILLKNHSNLPHSSFSQDNTFRIKKDKKLIKEIKVYEANEFLEAPEIKSDFIFLLGMNALIKKSKKEEKEKYKEAVLMEQNYLPEVTDAQKVKEFIFCVQIEKGVNVSYIESTDDLLREVKAVIRSLDEEEFVPKMKKQSNPGLFLKSVLEMMPGVSKWVANALSNHFINIFNLINELDSGSIEELEILSEDKKTKRKIGKKTSEVIKKYLKKQ